jgi:uncharacterized membrane protein
VAFLISLAKTLHILSATIFFGAGLMSAWWKVRADRSGDVKVVAWAQGEIVFADWVFTVPSGVVSPVTGAFLVWSYGLPWTADWVLGSLGGFAVATVCWLPAAWLQLRMRALADEAARVGGPLPPEFHRLNRIWLLLGVPAFAAAVFVIWTMVAKRLGL